MPIVDIELLDEAREPQRISKELLQDLTDALGQIFQSGDAGTWVRLRYLPRNRYAENRAKVHPSIRPVFIKVLKTQLQDTEELASEAQLIAETVSVLLERPVKHTHVLYEPEANGRIAFGGMLRTS